MRLFLLLLPVICDAAKAAKTTQSRRSPKCIWRSSPYDVKLTDRGLADAEFSTDYEITLRMRCPRLIPSITPLCRVFAKTVATTMKFFQAEWKARRCNDTILAGDIPWPCYAGWYSYYWSRAASNCWPGDDMYRLESELPLEECLREQVFVALNMAKHMERFEKPKRLTAQLWEAVWAVDVPHPWSHAFQIPYFSSFSRPTDVFDPAEFHRQSPWGRITIKYGYRGLYDPRTGFYLKDDGSVARAAAEVPVDALRALLRTDFRAHHVDQAGATTATKANDALPLGNNTRNDEKDSTANIFCAGCDAVSNPTTTATGSAPTHPEISRNLSTPVYVERRAENVADPPLSERTLWEQPRSLERMTRNQPRYANNSSPTGPTIASPPVTAEKIPRDKNVSEKIPMRPPKHHAGEPLTHSTTTGKTAVPVTQIAWHTIGPDRPLTNVSQNDFAIYGLRVATVMGYRVLSLRPKAELGWPVRMPFRALLFVQLHGCDDAWFYLKDRVYRFKTVVFDASVDFGILNNGTEDCVWAQKPLDWVVPHPTFDELRSLNKGALMSA
eukprot:GEMP01027224.1.p1 GENE.GEMP01027224.1~~GEMP01027224.1.p1  ORF type:complete len:555 (+),score=130.41 GEMP01027224.1:220-1884(+)